jgi:cysteine-rich repeat protein
MAGRIRKQDLIQAFREVGFCGDGALMTFYSNLLTYIDEDADVLASGINDPQADCDAMSFAVGFEAKQVLPGTAVEVPPRIECCEPGKTAEQCLAQCGDGKRSGDEKCDTAIPAGEPGACPTTCPTTDSCSRLVLTGSECSTECVATPITTIGATDGCCPSGANAITDKDCKPSCGNNVVEAGETCDPEGSCMPCPATDGCLVATTTGSAESCNLRCEVTAIAECRNGDRCCPASCNSGNDRDCSATCGNGMLDEGEKCETSGDRRCPASCDDQLSCTQDRATGSAMNCSLVCTHLPITQTVDGDGCCPPGATANGDSDCRSTCGNRVVEMGEDCDDGNESAGDGCVECKSEDSRQICLVNVGASDACAQCICSKCQQQTLACYGGSNQNDVRLCKNLTECKRESGCGNPGCLCGDSNLFACAAGVSNGPCKSQVFAAAKSESLADLGARTADTNFPLGRANALVSCVDTSCAEECRIER